jgi:hypothetical protein
VKNGVDIIIPSARLGWLPVSDGTVGLAGTVTSVIGIVDTYVKHNSTVQHRDNALEAFSSNRTALHHCEREFGAMCSDACGRKRACKLNRVLCVVYVALLLYFSWPKSK